jgi:dihydroflavonol-4-reductase
VGNNLVRLLLSEGQKVRVLLRERTLPRSLEGLAVEMAQGDVRDRTSLAEAYSGVKSVVHAAGFVHIGWSQNALHQEINVVGTRNVATLAREREIRLVYVSSVNALGLGRRNQPAGEDDAAPGIVECPYVESKRTAEEGVLALTREGLNATVVNPGFMLGPWDWKPSSGRMIVELARQFLPLAPSGGFSVCDVRDVCRAIVTAMSAGQVGGRYILAGRNMTYFELWQQITKLVGRRSPWFPAGPMQRWCVGAWGDLMYRISGREPDLNSAGVRLSSQFHYFRSDRARAELGYETRPLEETLRDAWQWLNDYGYIPKP